MVVGRFGRTLWCFPIGGSTPEVVVLVVEGFVWGVRWNGIGEYGSDIGGGVIGRRRDRMHVLHRWSHWGRRWVELVADGYKIWGSRMITSEVQPS